MSFGRIFITGGTGYVGKSLLDYRARHPDFLAESELVLLSRDPERFRNANPKLVAQPGISLIKGDARNFKFPEGDFDAIINAASPVLSAATDDETISVNVEGTQHLLDFAIQCRAKRMLVTSSGAVYGKQNRPLIENDEIAPSTAYGMAKVEVERMCVESGLSVGIARIFAQVGRYIPRQAHYAVGNFIQSCVEGNDIVIKGDGSPMRSYMYADDLVEWLFAILERGKSGRPYNVGSPDAISIRDLASFVRDTLQSSSEVRMLGEKISGAANYYVPDTSRAEKELGLRCTFTITQSILGAVG